MCKSEIPTLLSPYMPGYTEISKWCRKLGRLGRDWTHSVSLYNTGRQVFMVHDHPPFVRLTERSKWEWVRYVRTNLDMMRLIGVYPYFPPRPFTFFDNLGHLPNGNWVCRIGLNNQDTVLILQRLHLFHVVFQSGQPKTVFEIRPLPIRLFAGALEAGR